MKIQVSAQVLLVVAIVLLAANLVLTFAVHGATPAHAADRTCVGMAVDAGGNSVFRAWSDGAVETKSLSPTNGGPPRVWDGLP